MIWWTGFFAGFCSATSLAFFLGAVALAWVRKRREEERRAACVVQSEVPPERISETWAEDQRRWHEWLHRVDPDRSKP